MGICCSTNSVVPIYNMAEIQRQLEIVQDDLLREFQDMGFPTNTKLRMANIEWYQMVQRRGIPLPPTLIYPNPFTKEEILRNYDFTKIDKFALSKKSSCFLSKTPSDAVASLTRRYRNDEIEKFRVLFRWFASLNLHSINYSDVKVNEIRYLMYQIHRGQMSHSEVLCWICVHANIDCIEIKGHQKHEQFDFGEELTDDLRGSWNAVRLNNLWFLCNVRFASRSVNANERVYSPLLKFFETKVYERTLTYKYNDFYFLTNPEEMIYSHLPTNAKHELLAREVSNLEFRDQVNLSQNFFSLRLGIVSHPKGKIIANSIKNEIIIQTNESLPVFFWNELLIDNRTWLTSEVNDRVQTGNVDSQKFIAMFQDKQRHLLIIRLRLPQSARYKLQLFANRYKEKMTYLNCLEYAINFTKYENINVDPFPHVHQKELGPNYRTTKLNFIKMTPELGMYYTSDSFTEIRFEADDDEFDIYVVITSCGYTSESLRKYCISTFEHRRGLVKFYFPDCGEYGINIYAESRRPKYCCSCLCFNFCEKDEPNDYPSLCSYIAVCTQTPTNTVIFPKNDRITIGKRTAFLRLGLVVDQNFQSYQQCRESINFKFNKSKACQFKIKLLSFTDNEEEIDCSQYAFIENSLNSVKFFLNFPYKGMFKCFIYGKKLNSRKSYKLIYICYFDVIQAANNVISFPQITDKWRISETHRIIEPLRNLHCDESVQFQITGIQCQKMICRRNRRRDNTNNDDENSGSGDGDACDDNNDRDDDIINFTCENDVWTTNVDTGNQTDDLIIEIKLRERAKFFTEILRYKVSEQPRIEDESGERKEELIAVNNDAKMDTNEVRIEQINWLLELEKHVYMSEFINEDLIKATEDSQEKINVSNV
ncbi:DgyrCDS14507 [Dimorphilus gyrociliatus]|uniref:DgyrCDS14507 n=1 Tax=Dimorphilus gyrociliatus TaxID=2664684 RepID=A0A7I8WE75_9ANNE|nr:DgyrCDS14507 [Dimorphilus gyrociliatus]